MNLDLEVEKEGIREAERMGSSTSSSFPVAIVL